MSIAVSWPLVGREYELQQVADARAQARCAVVISGPAGVGKSRLAREALDGAASDGAVAGWVRATRSAASVPLGAFAAVLAPDVRSDDLFQLMQRSVQALREQADGRTCVRARRRRRPMA